MRKIVLVWMGVWACSSVSYAVWDFTIGDGQYEHGSVRLEGQESLLVTGGGAHIIIARDFSYIEVQGTAPLEIDVGGIYTIGLDDHSRLNYFGGEMGGFNIYDDATATFSGGRINHISSYQWSSNYIPHIEFVCDVDSVVHNTSTNVLTGNWLDGSSFNIQLHDQTGYDPAIENIFFTPEPMTLFLFGFGGLVVRSFGKKKLR